MLGGEGFFSEVKNRKVKKKLILENSIKKIDLGFIRFRLSRFRRLNFFFFWLLANVVNLYLRQGGGGAISS